MSPSPALASSFFHSYARRVAANFRTVSPYDSSVSKFYLADVIPAAEVAQLRYSGKISL